MSDLDIIRVSDDSICSQVSELLIYCAEAGEFVNPHTTQELRERLSYENACIIAAFDDERLAACLLLADKDTSPFGLEKKEWLLSELALAQEQEQPLPNESTKVTWISAVCTHPEYRKRGLAGKLFDEAGEATREIAAASNCERAYAMMATRVANKPMLDFAAHRGYDMLLGEYTEKYFGVTHPLSPLAWRILYKEIGISGAE